MRHRPAHTGARVAVPVNAPPEINRLIEDTDAMPANLIRQAARGVDRVGIKLVDDFDGLRQAAEAGQQARGPRLADARRDLDHRLAAKGALKISICDESRMRL